MMTPAPPNAQPPRPAEGFEPFDDLGERLADATRWDGPETALWQRALAESAPPAPLPFHARVRAMLTPSRLGLAACIMLLITAGVLITSPRVNGPPPTAGSSVASRALPSLRGAEPARTESADQRIADAATGTLELPAYDQSGFDPGTPPPPASVTIGDPEPRMAPGRPGGLPAPPAPGERAQARSIITRVNLELTAEDAALAFQRVSRLIDEARGEHIAESSMSGPDERPIGRIKLRVAATRVGDVLASCRAIGEVTSEQTSSEDVTDQVVDLNARLANEQAAEAELRELLAARQDSKLDEIMHVRESLKRVREEIERLTAQRDLLSNLTRLATIDVLIIQKGDEPGPDEGSLGAILSRELTAAWRDAQLRLGASLAWLVRTLVGGAVWWAIVLACCSGAWRLAKRQPGTRPAARPTA